MDDIDLTKQWTIKWPCIANADFCIVKNHAK